MSMSIVCVNAYPSVIHGKTLTLTYKQMIDKQLYKVKDNEQREEGVEMHVKGETPLHILNVHRGYRVRIAVHMNTTIPKVSI